MLVELTWLGLGWSRFVCGSFPDSHPSNPVFVKPRSALFTAVSVCVLCRNQLEEGPFLLHAYIHTSWYLCLPRATLFVCVFFMFFFKFAFCSGSFDGGRTAGMEEWVGLIWFGLF